MINTFACYIDYGSISAVLNSEFWGKCKPNYVKIDLPGMCLPKSSIIHQSEVLAYLLGIKYRRPMV